MRFKLGKDELDQIDGTKYVGDYFRLGLQNAASELVQNRLSRVRDMLQACEPEEATGALDRVDCTKNRIQEGLIGRIALQLHQVMVELGEVFSAFSEKIFEKIVQTSVSESGSTRRSSDEIAYSSIVGSVL